MHKAMYLQTAHKSSHITFSFLKQQPLDSLSTVQTPLHLHFENSSRGSLVQQNGFIINILVFYALVIVA